MSLCFCQECPCNCGAEEGLICSSCRNDRHCQNGEHAPDTIECPFCHNQIDVDAERERA